MTDDLLAQRQQTIDFINSNPLVVNLQRISTIPDGEGGVTTTLGPVGNQTLRLVEQPSTQAQVFRRTVDGQEVTPEFTLVCPYNADAENGDWFMRDGRKYEVVYVREIPAGDSPYVKYAEVAYRG